MTEAVERMLNLAYYLGEVRTPVSAARIRDEVPGYPAGQADEAFLRMLERDKDTLRSFGFVIEATPEGLYRLDGRATFAASLTLDPEEAAALRVVCDALIDDPSFPLAEDLRFALLKLSITGGVDEEQGLSRLADESPETQGEHVAVLEAAIRARKHTSFDYTNMHGESKRHDVEPYGLFAHSGRWYLVARDTALDQIRTYAVARAKSPVVNSSKPRQPDFERPAGFDVASFSALPFQYGTDQPTPFELGFSGSAARHAEALAMGKGSLSPAADGFTWRVDVRDPDRLLKWVVENGPGISILTPEMERARLTALLADVARDHEEVR